MNYNSQPSITKRMTKRIRPKKNISTKQDKLNLYQKRISQQREKTMKQFRKSINKCCFILSHGDYFPLDNNNIQYFKIPSNICLIQYSTPELPLTALEANYLIKYDNIYNCNPFKKQLTLIKKNDFNEKYKFNYRYTELQPNTTTKNLMLSFNLDEVEGIKLGILFPNTNEATKKQLIQKETILPLNELLNDLSLYFKKNYGNNIIKVIQISCRSGLFLPSQELSLYPSNYIIDELIRKLDAIKIKNGVDELYKKYYRKSIENITYQKSSNLYTIYDEKNNSFLNFHFYELLDYIFYIN